MAINFPSDRSELGFPPGPLQPGDLWVNNRIEYLWFESPDGTGAWSAKGANIDPSNYINKAEQFPAELDGSFNTGFTIADADRADNATLADEASKVTNTLKLNFTDASGNTTSIEYDGSTPKEISFSDTDINSQEVNLTAGFGVEITDDEISVVSNTPRAWSAGAAPGSSSNYAAEFTSGIWSKLKAYQADNAANLGGTPAASYYTAVQVDNRISQSVGNVDLTTAFDNQANTPITGANANLELNANGTEFIVDLAKSADGSAARMEIGQGNARSVIDSDGNAFLANPIFPHVELRGRRANTSFGYGFIGLTTGNPADIGAFVRSPQTNDRELIIQGETVRIRDAANPDGWVLAPPDGTNGGISHAQSDGVTYGSRDGGWVPIADDSGIPEPTGAAGNYVREWDGTGGSWVPLDTSVDQRIHCDIRRYFIDTWSNAFNACLTDNGVVYLPTGTYSFDSTLTVNNRSANIYGDGSGQTILQFSVNNGLSFTNLSQQEGNWDTVTLKGFTVNGTGSGTGIDIQYASSGNVAQKVVCEDVTVQNFNNGWLLTDTDLSTYSSCSALDCTTGVRVQSGAGDATNIRFNNWNIADCNSGFEVTARSEGIYLTDSIIIGCVTGVTLDGNTPQNPDAAEPFFVIRGNNIDCETTSLVMDGCIQASITDNSFYKRNGTAGNWIGVRILGDSFDNVFSNNIFNGLEGTENRLGISVERLAHSTFSNNHFLNLNQAYQLSWLETTNNLVFTDNDYREIDAVFVDPPVNSITFNLISRSHAVSEEWLDNRYHLLNGDGVFVYDANNANGFRLEPGGGGGGTTQNLQQVLDTGRVATGGNAFMRLSSSGNEARLDGTAGIIELTRTDGPFIDFKTNASADYDIRINQSGGNLILENTLPDGGVYVSDPDNGIFRLTPGGGVFPGDKVYVVDTNSDFANAFEAAFNAAVSNNGHVFVPGGEHKLSRNIQTTSSSSVHQVTVFGPSFASAEINCHTFQMHFRHPTNLRELKIRGATLNENDGSQWQVPTQSAGARGMLLFYRSSGGSEEDMDSSILNCDIKVGAMQNGYAIVYRGRNLKMHDCRLTRQKDNNVEGCLRMIYNITESQEIQGRLGWRRCSINDNTFHAWDETVCITVDFSNNVSGNVNIYGLIVSNNTLENGGIFMRTLGANTSERLVACNITDNTMHFIKPADMPCINIRASNSSITGNAVTLRGRNNGGIEINGSLDSNSVNGDSENNIIHNPTPFNLDNS